MIIKDSKRFTETLTELIEYHDCKNETQLFEDIGDLLEANNITIEYPVQKLLRNHGFKNEHTGGGCYAMTLYETDDRIWYCTNGDLSLPRSYPVDIGLYGEDMDPLSYFECNNEEELKNVLGVLI